VSGQAARGCALLAWLAFRFLAKLRAAKIAMCECHKSLTREYQPRGCLTSIMGRDFTNKDAQVLRSWPAQNGIVFGGHELFLLRSGGGTRCAGRSGQSLWPLCKNLVLRLRHISLLGAREAL
jgi:hypothetical protein